jgi:hypothetical protein
MAWAYDHPVTIANAAMAAINAMPTFRFTPRKERTVRG